MKNSRNARELGKRLLDGLENNAQNSHLSGDARIALVCGVEIVSNKEFKTVDPAMTMKIFKVVKNTDCAPVRLGIHYSLSRFPSRRMKWTRSSNASVPQWMESRES
ncbi:MAG: hypothetical protein IPJ46_01195 [Anaerolineales bacterium]|nr:hypothetical protein [Anaerolineales bacterium]